MRLIDKLFLSPEEFAGMKKRIEALGTIAQRKYNLPAVVADVINDLGLRPHRGSPKNAASDIEITYEVQNSGNLSGIGRRSKPFFESTIIERQEGVFYDTPSDTYRSHMVKRRGVFSLKLTEDGEFHVKSPFSRSVRLGTTAIIKGHEDLSVAMKDQVQRKKPMV